MANAETIWDWGLLAGLFKARPDPPEASRVVQSRLPLRFRLADGEKVCLSEAHQDHQAPVSVCRCSDGHAVTWIELSGPTAAKGTRVLLRSANGFLAVARGESGSWIWSSESSKAEWFEIRDSGRAKITLVSSDGGPLSWSGSTLDDPDPQCSRKFGSQLWANVDLHALMTFEPVTCFRVWARLLNQKGTRRLVASPHGRLEWEDASGPSSSWDLLELVGHRTSRVIRLYDRQGRQLLTRIRSGGSVESGFGTSLVYDQAGLLLLEQSEDRPGVRLRNSIGLLGLKDKGVIEWSASGTEFQVLWAIRTPSLNEPRVRVWRDAGSMFVDATVLISCNPEVALGVVTDYGNLHTFITDMEGSKVLECLGNKHYRILLEEKHSFLFFTLVARMTLNVRETPSTNSVSLELAESAMLRKYKGEWHASKDISGKNLMLARVILSPRTER